jgi:hypothetical protein
MPGSFGSPAARSIAIILVLGHGRFLGAIAVGARHEVISLAFQ